MVLLDIDVDRFLFVIIIYYKGHVSISLKLEAISILIRLGLLSKALIC